MDQLKKALFKYFGYESFRLGQKEIITDILEGTDVFATLPTGSGKSLCYQLPGFFLEGTIIVVTPLLSLMEDQVKELKKKGIKAAVAINSFNSVDERNWIIDHLHTYKFIYLSPEMLQNKYIQDKFKHLTIALFVIDEAHCISQWGHEFRPDYLKLNEIVNKLGQPTTLAITATATPDVQEDILNHFEAIDFHKHIYPIDRDNIALIVEKVNDKASKVKYLIDLLKTNPVPAIIYFSSKKESERVCFELSQALEGLNVAYYHSGLETSDRLLIQEQFMENQLDIICATSAFGMGVNKENIRLVIHFHLPTQLESLIQEIGRAGRDQQSSVSIVLYAPGDQYFPTRMIESELPSIDIVGNMLSFIKQVNSDNGFISIEQLDIESNWDISETQWRFLKNFFEEAGIIEGKWLDPTKINQQFNQNITRKINNRNNYKLHKLNELFDWLHTEDCRRIKLHQSFQDTVQPAKYYCCDQCGFKIDQWSPKDRIEREIKETWQEQLKSILLPFEVGDMTNE